MQVTDQAVIELRNVLQNFGEEGAGIRIYSAQGCCGPSIQMDIALHPNANQVVITIDNINFFIDSNLIDIFLTVTLDYDNNQFRLLGFQRQGGGCCS